MTKVAASDSFNFFLPLAKVDSKTRTVSGYASTPALDLDGEIVALDAIKNALPGYWEWRNIRQMHQPSAVGVAKEANMDDKGLFLTAKIVDDEAWKKCVEGVYKGYSVGGRKLAKTGNVITEIELIEVSLVDRPANPECRIEVAKRAKESDAGAYLIKSRAPRSPESKAVAKMASAVKTLAKAPAARDGFSLPAVKVAPPAALCKKHGVANCDKCAAKFAKRDVKRKERESLAAQGEALPDGSFPIKNKGDLANARQEVGRSKNPEGARALIRRRASQLGVKLPDKWSKKLAKGLIAKAEAAFLDLNKNASAQPPFLTLSADVEGKDWLKSQPELDNFGLGKGGATIADDIELNLEAIKMTTKIDPLEKFLSDLEKAGREPSRSQRMDIARGNLKKARGARKEVEGFIKDAHGLLKSAYLAKQALIKAGKKPDNDGDADDMDTMGKVMGALNKAFGSATSMKTFMKAADTQLKKAAGRSGQRGQEVSDGNAHYQVPAGVKDLSMNDLTTAGPGGTERGSEPPILGMEHPFPGKAAKYLRNYVSPEVAKLMTEKAAAEAKVQVLESMPAAPVHGRRPLAFDVTKANGIAGNPDAKDLFKGVNVGAIGSGNEAAHVSEVGKVIGNLLLSGKFGKSITDPNFHGAAGGTN